MRVLLAATLAALIVACAAEPRRPAGPPRVAVAAGEAGALLKEYRLDFRDIAAESLGVGRLEPWLEDHEVWVELPAPALFEQGNAQLKVEALKPLADIAGSIAARGAVVTHLVGFAADEVSVDLADRRAGSVLESFSRQSITPARLRAEARIDADRADRLAIAVRLVVVGRENEAWMPPALGR
jgi:hypothetical protein